MAKHKNKPTSYVQSDGRIVRLIGRKPVRFLADGATPDPVPIHIPDRPPKTPKPVKSPYIGNQHLTGAAEGRPGQGCVPDGRDAVCGACARFILKTPYEGICALFAPRMSKFKGEPPRFSLDAPAGPDFEPKPNA